MAFRITTFLDCELLIKDIERRLDDIEDKIRTSKHLSLNDELEKMAGEYKVSVKDILGRERLSELVAARKKIAKRLREKNYSFSTIARILGRDHTTILHYFKGEPKEA